ncbi:tail fiber protein [Synechococcus phage S-N03]|uniref:Tail fiber protein n=1 Tax=Synechococcus phage S-N03 TaxID=2718943 RepID=A0A6G8R669_9CAUD|nr:tail fiber protein [Synechococcus phage S-N03]QIN96648.1 tail fiber protein [Synechococcus phage S-N03]
MTLNFPTSPNVNDTYTYNGTTFVWDGEKWDASTPFLVNTANIANDAVTPDKVAVDDYTFSAINGGPLAGMRNQIINGDFRIWQRGTTGFPGGTEAYTADRWRTKDGGRIQRTGTAPDGFADAIMFQAAANATWIRQAVELPRAGNPGPFVTGSTWTASCWTTLAAGDIFFGNGFADGNGNLNFVELTANTAMTSTGETNNGFTRFSITFTISAAPANTNLALIPLFGSFSGSEGFITGCQLEPGPVASVFEVRPIQTELALCQRYYQTIVGALLQANRTSFTEQRNFQAPRTVTMRAAPTETFVDVTTNGTMSGIQVYGNSGGWGAAGVPSASNTVTALDINADAEL